VLKYKKDSIENLLNCVERYNSNDITFLKETLCNEKAIYITRFEELQSLNNGILSKDYNPIYGERL